MAIKPEEARKLLGGYATGNLSDEEMRELFTAALEDQELFDALSQEQALKELIDQPGARERLIGALTPTAKPIAWWARPWAWAGAATLAVAGIALFAILNSHPRSLEIAQNAPVSSSVATPAAPPPSRERPAIDSIGVKRPEAASTVPPKTAAAPRLADERTELDRLMKKERAAGAEELRSPSERRDQFRDLASGKPTAIPERQKTAGGADQAQAAGQQSKDAVAEPANQLAQNRATQGPLPSNQQQVNQPFAAPSLQANENARIAKLAAGAVRKEETKSELKPIVKWSLSSGEIRIEARGLAFLYVVTQSPGSTQVARRETLSSSPVTFRVPPGVSEVWIVLSTAAIDRPQDLKPSTSGASGVHEGQTPIVVRIPIPPVE
jgi:hypothetical protein